MNTPNTVTVDGAKYTLMRAAGIREDGTEDVGLWEKAGDKEHWYTPDLESIVRKSIVKFLQMPR